MRQITRHSMFKRQQFKLSKNAKILGFQWYSGVGYIWILQDTTDHSITRTFKIYDDKQTIGPYLKEIYICSDFNKTMLGYHLFEVKD